MAKGICPDCGELATIEPTGESIGSTGTARWWRVAYHPVKTERIGSVVVETRCDGTGKKV